MKKLEFEYLPLDKIDVGISNVRKANLKEGLDDLKKSIQEIGIMQPVVVFRKRNRYELIIGQRRYLACKELGLPKIPALITNVRNETEAIVKSFSENIHRLDLEYRDKMKVATQLLDKLKKIKKVAGRLGVSQQTVRNYLGYAAVPEEIKRMVDEGKLSASTATRIAKSISDKKLAVEIAKKVEETPRGDDRRKLIDLAKENPRENASEIAKLAKREKFTRITIDLTPKVARALEQASDEYASEREEIATIALEEWLEERGFIQ